MARALLGHVGNANDQLLALEVSRLRQRVHELEAQLAELRADNAEIDIELDRMTEEITLNPA
jgi:antitoxin component of MazEF toxin-antitoxin module